MCGLAGAAVAEGDASWDGHYEHTNRGGDEKCPDPVPVVVSGGAFSFAWNVRLGDRVYHVGTIAGSVRPSGLAVFKATVFSPLAHDTQAALEDAGDTVEELTAFAGEMSIAFSANGDRPIDLESGMCYSRWSGGAAVGKPAKAAARPSKPPPLLAAGSPKWDATYGTLGHDTDAWWCPKYDGFARLVVKKGRFSLPWHVDAIDGRGHDWGGEIALGQIDGSIAASGAVKLRPRFAVSELPPELVGGRDAKEATLAYVKAHAPTMKLTTVSGTRHMHLAFGKACSYDLEVWDPVATKMNKLSGIPHKPASSSQGTGTSRRGNHDGATASHPASPPPPPPPPPPKKGKANGAECSYDSECASDHCLFDKCSSGDSSKKALGNGMACDYNSECASDRCYFNKCSSGDSSKKDFGTGTACEFSSDCASGECTFNKCE